MLEALYRCFQHPFAHYISFLCREKEFLALVYWSRLKCCIPAISISMKQASLHNEQRLHGRSYAAAQSVRRTAGAIVSQAKQVFAIQVPKL
jgi:hypothetical protein